MGRSPCCDKNGLKKGPWTPEEDAKLVHYIHLHGPGNWRNLPKNAELKRCGKSCRLRWTNYLRPDIKRGRFSFDEEETIIQLHSVLGNKWSTIAARLPGRTDNEIKNYWNTHIRKRLVQMGLDPVTHAPRLDPLNCSFPSLLNLSSLLGSQSLVNPQLVLLRQLVTSTLFSQLQQQQQQDQQNQFYNTLLQNQIIPTNDVSNDQGFSMDQISKQLTMQNNNIDQSGLVNSNNTSLSRSSISSAHENNVIPYSTSLMGNNDLVSQLPSYVQCNSNPTSDHDLYPENSYLNQTSLDDGNKNFNLESVMSTPLSSPTPSTYINSSSTDQDDQQSYCSNLFKFEIPESDFDISDFL